MERVTCQARRGLVGLTDVVWRWAKAGSTVQFLDRNPCSGGRWVAPVVLAALERRRDR
jgi:hypothetical protein